jgi:hypothetical protein
MLATQQSFRFGMICYRAVIVRKSNTIEPYKEITAIDRLAGLRLYLVESRNLKRLIIRAPLPHPELRGMQKLTRVSLDAFSSQGAMVSQRRHFTINHIIWPQFFAYRELFCYRKKNQNGDTIMMSHSARNMKRTSHHSISQTTVTDFEVRLRRSRIEISRGGSKKMNSDSLNSYSNLEIVCVSFSLFSPLPFQIGDPNSAILDPHNSE